MALQKQKLCGCYRIMEGARGVTQPIVNFRIMAAPIGSAPAGAYLARRLLTVLVDVDVPYE